MQDPFDLAEELAKSIRALPEYEEYIRLKEAVLAGEENRLLIKRYKKLQFQAQTESMAGGEPSPELMATLSRLGETLAFDPLVGEFFAAEYRLNTVVAKVYKILGSVCDLGVDLFE